VTIDFNNLFQSFDLVRKSAEDCLTPETAQNLCDDRKKLIDICNGPTNELTFQLLKGKEVRRCHIMAERPIYGTFQTEFIHSGQVPL
jgi:hypothetical protein